MKEIDRKQLQEALTAAFTDIASFSMLLAGMNRSWDTFAGKGTTLPQGITEVIAQSVAHNWLPALLDEVESSPARNNPMFRAFVAAHPHIKSGNQPSEIESNAEDAHHRLVEARVLTLDVAVWRERYSRIEAQTCRIEVALETGSTVYGTGFLLGPSVVMTNYHIMEPVYLGKAKAQNVVFRFDHKRLAEGNLNSGETYSLATAHWDLDTSASHKPVDADAPADRLDYALLCLSEPAGEKRGWMTPLAVGEFPANMPLAIFHHPNGDPLKFAMSTNGVSSVTGGGTRLRHRVNTEVGSSGAPLFDQKLNLVALHHAGDPDFRRQAGWNQAVPFAAILGLLERRGKKALLGSISPPPAVAADTSKNLDRETRVAAGLADGLAALDREALSKVVADARRGRPVPDFGSPEELIKRAERERWLEDLAAAALAERPSDSTLFAAAQELGLTSLTDATLRQIAQAAPPWDVNSLHERLGVVERQVCLVKWRGVTATGFLIGSGLVLLPGLGPWRWSLGAPPADLELVFDYKRPLGRSLRVRGSDLTLAASSEKLGAVLLHANALEGRGSVPVSLDPPANGLPVLVLHHPKGHLLAASLANQGGEGGAWGAPGLDSEFRVFETAMSESGTFMPAAAILRWLAEEDPAMAARCSPEFGLRLMTDTEMEPRPEVRAAMGRAMGRLRFDTRRGVGVKDGVPDIDWARIPSGGKTFYMARYPVTNAQFKAFLTAPDGYPDDRWWKGLTKPDRPPEQPSWNEPNHPRVIVSWYEAMAFCSWLSHRLGYEVRLPAEQEWERAARGMDGREYPWGHGYREGFANVDETADKAGPHYLARTSAVGIYPQGASAEGVLDLAGNVWEWCLNEYEKPERMQRSGTEPRVLRGGSWVYVRDFARAAYRGLNLPFNRYYGIGFRVVCSSPIR